MTLTATDRADIPGYWHKGRFYPIVAGGDSTTEGEGTPPVEGGSTEGASSGGTGTTPPPETGDGKTLTQEEVNAIVARETDKAKRGKLDPKELGFESGKELKEFIDQAKQYVQDQKSEGEKALEDAKKAARDEARAEVLGPAKELVLQAEFKLAAMSQGVALPNDALILAQAIPDLWENVEISEEGVVTGFDDAFFKTLKEQKPFLFGQKEGATPPPGDIGAGAQGGAGTQIGDSRVDPARQTQLRQRYPILERLAGSITGAQQGTEGK